jgi:hypothetical protein
VSTGDNNGAGGSAGVAGASAARRPTCDDKNDAGPTPRNALDAGLLCVLLGAPGSAAGRRSAAGASRAAIATTAAFR